MEVGVRALPILSLITYFIGLILALQSAYELSKLGVMSVVPRAVALSMSRELGPLITAIGVIGRSGSAFAAEIGTMKVTEEFDALETMAISPIHFLVTPKVLAMIVMLPCLTIWANLMGIRGRGMKTFLVSAALLTVCAVAPTHAEQSKTEVQARLDGATTTLRDLAATPDKGIPDDVYKNAKCIAVVPRLAKGAFVFGGKHGRGISTCKLPDGTWSAPAFFTISGGSWGLQVGLEDIDLVMMIMTDEGARQLLENKFQVGANASAAAGPVGRHASAETDWKLGTEILTYSRSKGLFAGIDLDGSWIESDSDSTKALYGKNASTGDLLTGKVPVPSEAKTFIVEAARARTASE